MFQADGKVFGQGVQHFKHPKLRTWQWFALFKEMRPIRDDDTGSAFGESPRLLHLMVRWAVT